MSDYIFLAALSPLLWAVVNVIDDYQIKKIYRTPSLAVIMTGLFLLFPLVTSSFFFKPFALWPTLLGIMSGVMIVFASWFYFRALSNEDTSIVVAMWSLTPVVVYFLSYFFLDEVLNAYQTIGSIIIILGAVLISLFGKKRYHFSGSLLVMLFASVLYAVSSVLEKSTYNYTVDFFSGFFVITLGMVSATLLFLFNKDNMRGTVDVFKTKKKYLVFIFISEVINAAAIFIQNYALSKGSVTIVKVIEGLQPVFVLLLVIFLAYFMPHFKSQFDRKTILPKVVIMSFMLIGFRLMY